MGVGQAGQRGVLLGKGRELADSTGDLVAEQVQRIAVEDQVGVVSDVAGGSAP